MKGHIGARLGGPRRGRARYMAVFLSVVAWGGPYWDRGTLVPELISDDVWRTPAPHLTIGRTTFFAPQVMEGTADYRGMSLDGYLDGVSLMSPSDIGETVWLRRAGGEWEGPFLDVDCSTRADMWVNITVNREVVEVGFETAERWGMAHLLGEHPWYDAHQWTMDVMVYIGGTPPQRGIYPTFYREWFLRLVEEDQHDRDDAG